MTLADQVRATDETELDRLGSEKALLALTDAQLDTTTVLERTGAALASARDGLADLASDAGAETVATAVADARDALAVATDRVADSLDGEFAADSAFLALDAETDDERVGAGLVGLPLVLDRLLLQCVSFFVNEADAARADLFRELRNTTGEIRELTADVDVDVDEQAARTAASAVVATAYDEYAGRLERMGFDPKPVC
jgi:chemotaxis regulatin CheY-phosphate phosphatase CheZ